MAIYYPSIHYYYLWGGQFREFNNLLWKQLPFVGNYIDSASCVIDAFMLPMSIRNKDGTALTANNQILCGDKTYELSSEVKVPGYLFQPIDYDYATFSVDRTTLDYHLKKNFTDYSTFSKYLLYIPFFGYHQLENDVILFCDVLNINYRINFGDGVCFVRVTAEYNSKEITIMEMDTSIAIHLPISGTDQGKTMRGIISSIGSLISTGGVLMGMPVSTTIGGAASSISKNRELSDISKKRNKNTGRMITTKSRNLSDTTSQDYQYSSTKNYYYSKSRASGEIISGFNNYFNSQTALTVKTNTQSSDSAFFCGYEPFIYVIHPKTNYFNGFNKIFGRPLNDYRKLNKLRGYTKVSAIHLNISCLESELDEIEELLYSGVILNTNAPIPDPPPEPEPEPTPTPTPAPDTPKDDDPISPNAPTLPEGETATMLCCFNGKFRVTGMRGKPSDTCRPRNHYGLDLVGMDTPATNTPVYAISSGWVKLIDQGTEGLGKCVHVQMDNKNYYGEWILYGHLSKFEVKNGQYVEKGQLIGIMGNTGASKGWHTHLEWRNKYDKYDPDFNKYDICKFTGIPNTSVEGQNVHIGSPIYKTANGASVQSKLGLENQTIEYLESYEYADDLMKKIDEHTK